MAKFITGENLGDAVYDIIWKAEKQLLIVSPYISLGDYFKTLFNKHLKNPKLHITIIFGKNEGHVNKSFNKSDLEYFMQFQNISIVYVPNLHAKYYANENMGVLTSINLYDFSFKNNIEFGVLYENNALNRIAKNTDDAAWNSCLDLADENEVVYVNRPIFQKKLLGLGKDYINSKVLCDRTGDLYRGRTLGKTGKKLSEYPEELDHKSEFAERPVRQEEPPKREIIKSNYGKPSYHEKKTYNDSAFVPGFCIRTGEKIPFNPERPLCYQAFQSWNQFGNPDYPEKFCHFSGEPSNGETSVNRPILNKNWRKAQQLARF